ncbi:MAG: M28 family peptidase [Chloroflexi bacterium]|nr:M28 family peptidase [Chloroflexota bacterium]
MATLAGFSGKSNQERQAYLAERLFPEAGLTDITLQRVYYDGGWGEEYGNWDGLHNVIGWRRGSLPEQQRRRIVVGAHYDKVTYPWRSATPGHSDGILDNGTGAALLARLAREVAPPKHDLVVVGFATEEPPPFFAGSTTYFGALSPEERDAVLAYVNLDVLGRGELAMVMNSSPPLAAVALARAASGGLGLTWRAVSLDVNSDHLPALSYGIPVLALTSTDYDGRHIHAPEDRLSAVDPAAYARHYATIRAILEALDQHFAGP